MANNLKKIPSIEQIEALHKKYAPSQKVFDLVYGHCQIVEQMALWCSQNSNLVIDQNLLSSSALLHDLGSYVFFDKQANNLNSQLYPLHAILGAKIVRDEGLEEKISFIIETHILTGLTKQEIKDYDWRLPLKDYLPQTIEAQIVGYADCFHSKHPVFNSFNYYYSNLEKNLPMQAKNFKILSEKFGIPDVQSLAEQYHQSIR